MRCIILAEAIQIRSGEITTPDEVVKTGDVECGQGIVKIHDEVVLYCKENKCHVVAILVNPSNLANT